MNKKIVSINDDNDITHEEIAKAIMTFVVKESKYFDKELLINFLKNQIREEPTYKKYYDAVSLLLFKFCLERETYIPLLSAWMDKVNKVFEGEKINEFLEAVKESAILEKDSNKFIALQSLFEYRIQIKLQHDNKVSLREMDQYLQSNMWLLLLNHEERFMGDDDVKYVRDEILLVLNGFKESEFVASFNGLRELYELILLLGDEKLLNHSEKTKTIEILKDLLKASEVPFIEIDYNTQNKKLKELLNSFKDHEVIAFTPLTKKFCINLVDNMIQKKQIKSLQKAVKEGSDQFVRITKIPAIEVLFKKVRELYLLSTSKEIPETVKSVFDYIKFLMKETDLPSLGLIDTMFAGINEKYFDNNIYPHFVTLMENENISEKDIEDMFPKSFERLRRNYEVNYINNLKEAHNNVAHEIATKKIILVDNFKIKWNTEIFYSFMNSLLKEQESPKSIKIEEMQKELGLTTGELELLNKCGFIRKNELDNTIVHFNLFIEETDVLDCLKKTFPLRQFKIAVYWRREAGRSQMVLTQLLNTRWTTANKLFPRATTLHNVWLMLEEMIFKLQSEETKREQYITLLNNIKKYILEKYGKIRIKEHKEEIAKMDTKDPMYKEEKYSYLSSAGLLYIAINENDEAIRQYSTIFKDHITNMKYSDIEWFYLIPNSEEAQLRVLSEKTLRLNLPEVLKPLVNKKNKEIINVIKLAIKEYYDVSEKQTRKLDNIKKLFKYYFKLLDKISGSKKTKILLAYEEGLKSLDNVKPLQQLFTQAYNEIKTKKR